MKDFIISTDSTADLPISYIEDNKILIHPLNYIVDDIEYVSDILEFPTKDFYKSMRDGKKPTTCASNPEYIRKLMKKKIDEGYDILHISFSSALSSSYSNAVLSANTLMEEIPDANIVVVDSLSATVGQGLVVYKAVQLKKAGKSIDEIATWINENRQRIIHQFIVDDLFHLVRGGRLSKTTAFIGTALHIQPLLKVDNEGRLYNIGKIRGRKKALKILVDNIKENTKGIEIDTVFISHADCIEDAELVAENIKNMYFIENIMISEISPTIGAHTGAGAVVVAYLGDER